MIKRLDDETQAKKLGEILRAKRVILPEIVKSVNIRRFLKFCSDLYLLSFDNQLALFAMMPEATCVAGVNAWLKEGRKIKPGQEPVYIIADQIICTDPGKIAVGEDGAPLEKDGVLQYETQPAYQNLVIPVPVYDISQTQRDEDIEAEQVSAIETPDFFDYISSQNLLITAVDKMDEAHKYVNAYYDSDVGEIIIRRDTPKDIYDQELMHAYVSFIFDGFQGLEQTPGGIDPHSCTHPDIAIECICWIINQHFGLKQTVRTFGDLDVWKCTSDDKDSPDNKEILDQAKNDLQVISYYAQQIIQHLKGFPLAFQETSIVNSLMVTDKAAILNDLYHRLDTHIVFELSFRGCLSHVFEALVNGLDDKERTDVFKDRLRRRIMSYPPYHLKRTIPSKERYSRNTELVKKMMADREHDI